MYVTKIKLMTSRSNSVHLKILCGPPFKLKIQLLFILFHYYALPYNPLTLNSVVLFFN